MILARVVPGQVWEHNVTGRQVQVVAANGVRAVCRPVKRSRGAQYPMRKGVRSIARYIVHEDWILLSDPEDV